ncbi:MAG: hypothetical protein ACREAA_13660 [Candidatus Polarisedimenticolia bacterium]
MLTLTVLLTVTIALGSNVHCVNGEDTHSAIESFIAKVAAYKDKTSRVPPGERGPELRELISSEAKRMQCHVPDVLDDLGMMLLHRDEDESRLDELILLKHPTDAELKEMMLLLDKREKSVKTPRCEIALLMGELGHGAEDRAVAGLLAAVPLPERVEDSCVAKALMMIGPGGYRHIVDSILKKTSPERIHVALLALLAASTDTDFPELAGLGPEERWDETVPTSRRGARKLTRKWLEWWGDRAPYLSWNQETGLLSNR